LSRNIETQRTRVDLQKVLRLLHLAMMLGVVGWGALCSAAKMMHASDSAEAVAGSSSGGSSDGLQAEAEAEKQLFVGAVGSMLAVMTLLGGTLMGMLPFCLQQACYTVAPASENVVSGLIYLVAMVVAASLTQLTSMIAPIASIALVVALLAAEFGMFWFWCKLSPPRSDAYDEQSERLLN
jgi:hypothetical protein